MTTQLSVIGSWLTLSVKALSTYGIDGESFVKSVGLDPGAASDPDYRIPLSATRGLWEAAVDATGDEAFGLRAGSFVHPTTFQALGLVMLSSGSLREFFEYWCRYLCMYSNGGYASLKRVGEESIFEGGSGRGSDNKPHVHDSALDATIAALVTLCRMHYGVEFSPVRVVRMGAPPLRPKVYEDFYRCPVSFEADAYYLHMTNEQLDSLVPRGNTAIASEMERLIHDYLLRMDQSDLVNQVRENLIERLPTGNLTMDEAAYALHMSSRTLRRRLADEGVEYRHILDDVRRELAEKYIRHPSMSLIDVSFLLGFSNSSNFARTFKRWFQQTPNEYRRQFTRSS